MNRSTLIDLVSQNLLRGACTCGRCADAGPNPEAHQPVSATGHTADVAFFKVALKPDTDVEKLKADFLAAIPPAWLDGKERNYLAIGAEVDDQGLALMLFGLGAILGVWKLLTPKSVLGSLVTDEMAMTLAGQGMVAFKAPTVEVGLPTWIVFWDNGEVSHETEPPDKEVFKGRAEGPFQNTKAAVEELHRQGYKEKEGDECYYVRA